MEWIRGAIQGAFIDHQGAHLIPPSIISLTHRLCDFGLLIDEVGCFPAIGEDIVEFFIIHEPIAGSPDGKSSVLVVFRMVRFCTPLPATIVEVTEIQLPATRSRVMSTAIPRRTSLTLPKNDCR